MAYLRGLRCLNPRKNISKQKTIHAKINEAPLATVTKDIKNQLFFPFWPILVPDIGPGGSRMPTLGTSVAKTIRDSKVIFGFYV